MMGMFDYIRCKMPLPADPAPPQCEWFQTKDVPTAALYLDKWTIEADGRLIRHAYRVEDHSDQKAKGLLRFKGCMTKVFEPENDTAVPYHGDISFGHYDSRTHGDWDYVARFTDGVCTRIWLDEYSPPTGDTK